MKTNSIVKNIFLIIIGASLLLSCNENIEIVFEKQLKESIFDHLKNDTANKFSSFIAISKSGNMVHTLSARNTDLESENKYTLFLPNNKAIDQFIENDGTYSSLNMMLEDSAYCRSFVMYHILNKAYNTSEFPLGNFSETNLSLDYLTVSFKSIGDSLYYSINNEATIIKQDIEKGNGFIHEIDQCLQPVFYTTFEKLQNNPKLSIFYEAVLRTNNQDIININYKSITVYIEPVTLFVEPDSVYNKYGIYSIDDLINYISPNDNDYLNLNNLLNLYVRNHFLKGNYFLSDFNNNDNNYPTHSTWPVNVKGKGVDMLINAGNKVYINNDSIVSIKFFYDLSNELSRSGSIHYIDKVMARVAVSAKEERFNFRSSSNDIDFEEYDEVGDHTFEKTKTYVNLSWTGPDFVYFVIEPNKDKGPYDNSYLQIGDKNSDFSIKYKIKELVPGKYEIQLRAEMSSRDNAMLQCYLDSTKIGGLINLNTALERDPYQWTSIGVIEIKEFERHEIEFRSLIPGMFKWDEFKFIPKK